MLFKNSSIYILARLIPGLMTFAALSIYTHLLSPDEYGVYTLIFSATILLHNVVYNWLPASTLRFWSSQNFTHLEFTSTLATSYFRISLGLFFIVVVAIAIYWQQAQASWILSSFMLLQGLALFNITQSLFNAKIQPQAYAYMAISYSVLSLLLGSLLAYSGLGAIGVLAGMTLSYLIPVFFVFKSTWLPFESKAYNTTLFKKLLTYGLPFASAALLEEVSKVSDRFMLAWLHDKAQAGLYAAGYDLSGNTLLLLMAAVNLAAYPEIIKLLETQGKKAAMDYFRHYAVLLLGISIPAIVGLNLVGPDLVYLIIDEEFRPSVIFLLPWITAAVFVMGLQATYFDIAFQLGHSVITVAKIGVAIAVVNIILNWWLIPGYGMKGAAIATLSSFTMGSILSAVLGRQCFKLPFPFIDFAKILIASMIMAFCLWWLKDFRGWGWLILQIFTGIISYAASLIALNIMGIRPQIRNFIARTEQETR